MRLYMEIQFSLLTRLERMVKRELVDGQLGMVEVWKDTAIYGLRNTVMNQVSLRKCFGIISLTKQYLEFPNSNVDLMILC